MRLLALVIGFLAFNRGLDLLRDGYAETAAWKLFYVSFLPWFYMFLVGVLAQRNLDWLLADPARPAGVAARSATRRMACSSSRRGCSSAIRCRR